MPPVASTSQAKQAKVLVENVRSALGSATTAIAAHLVDSSKEKGKQHVRKNMLQVLTHYISAAKALKSLREQVDGLLQALSTSRSRRLVKHSGSLSLKRVKNPAKSRKSIPRSATCTS